MTGRHIQAISIGALVFLAGCSNGAVSSQQTTARTGSPPSASASSPGPSLAPAPSQEVRKRASMPTHALATRLGRRLQGKDGEDSEAARSTTSATTTIRDGRLFTPVTTPVNNPYGALSSNLALAQADGSTPGRAPAEVIEAVDDAALVEAQERHLMNYQVEGAARVLKILPEDLKGRAHQRFLLKLSNGGTILVAHNIDLAPRVPLSPGDVVRVRGEFIWNQKGGVIHYTHRSTSRARQGGWIRFRSLFYQ